MEVDVSDKLPRVIIVFERNGVPQYEAIFKQSILVLNFFTYICIPIPSTQRYIAPAVSKLHYSGHDGVSNHQPNHGLLNRLFRRRSKKTSMLRVTGLSAGKSPVTDYLPAQMPSNAKKCFHLMTSSWLKFITGILHWEMPPGGYRYRYYIGIMSSLGIQMQIVFKYNDDVIKWKMFSALLAICAGNSPNEGQWRGDLLFSLICAW